MKVWVWSPHHGRLFAFTHVAITGWLFIYVLAMVAVIVGVDVLFLQHQPWLRLEANIGIVLVFGAVSLIIWGRR
jgi:hypothetical protein